MNVLAILKDFTFRCKSVFENTTTKMSKRFLNWLILTIRTVALIPGKVNFTRLSRYGGRTAKTFASNFKTSVDWMKVNIGMAQDCFGPADDMAVAIDPSFISKSRQTDVWHRPFLVRGGTTCETRSGDNGNWGNKSE